MICRGVVTPTPMVNIIVIHYSHFVNKFLLFLQQFQAKTAFYTIIGGDFCTYSREERMPGGGGDEIFAQHLQRGNQGGIGA